ncbi:MAG: ATP-binding protein [Isosphaeraceae bacterium]
MDEVADLLNVWIETVRDYAIFLVDLGGRVASWNVGAERILGYRESEILGLPLAIFFTPEDLERGTPNWEMDEALAQGRASDDRWHIRKDGSRFWCSGMLMAARDAEGSIRGFVKIMRDLTERKHMEEQLRARAEELQEADRCKNEFLAMLSHELRNPLAPILTSLYILKEKRTAEASGVEEIRAMIERQVMNLKRLIDDLLDVSRMAMNRIQIHREPVDLTEIARRATEDVRPLIQEREHELTVTTAAGPLILMGDTVRLEQVLLNILTNAAKFSDPGGQLWLTIERDEDFAVVRVRDAGIGIAPDMIVRAFDLFAQADQGLDRARGGLGIGLTLARNLVTLHGGTIEARSDGEGKGSEFIIRLPLASLETPGPEGSTVSSGSDDLSAGVTDVQTGRRVLVVDDNRDAAHSLELYLSAAGLRVQLAHDGTTALAMVQNDPPDAVVLDIGLPHLDGIEVGRHLRDQLHGPLIALSGYSPDKNAPRIFDRYLLKPVMPDELLKLLTELMATRPER